MIPVHHLERMIPDLTGCAVVIIAGCSFILSFFNLKAVAIEAGIDPLLSGLWPVCVDALLCAGSLMILRSSIRGDSALAGWLVLIIFTGVSTTFNVLHSPDGWINQAAHAIPPVSLCVSVELLMMCIKSDLTEQHAQDDQTPCTSDVHCVQVECTPEPDIVQVEEQQITTPEPMNTAEMIKQHFTEHPESSISSAARTIGVSRTTISRHLNALTAAGLIIS